MAFGVGLALIVVTVVMIMAARPKDGISAPFLKVWFVGQAYVLAALTSAVIGITLMIANRPF